MDLVDAEFPRHGLGGGAVVAGEHHDAQPLVVQRLESARRGRLDRIGDAHQTGGLAVHRDEHHGLALGAPLLGPRGQGAGIDVEGPPGAAVAERDRAPLDRAAHALAGDRVEIARVGQLQAPLRGRGDDRGGERMLARPLEAGREPEQIGLVDAFGRDERGHWACPR